MTDSWGSVTLGEIVAAYRQRKIHPQTGRPWSQEELAFAVGSAQPHISRIESNRKIPQYSTLVLICDALDLSPSERAYLFSRAGYKLNLPLPDGKAVESALAKLVPFLDSCPYPATMVDEGERVWHLNPIAVALWGEWTYGATDQATCNRLTHGKRIVELIFDPDAYEVRMAAWNSHYEDADQCLDRIVALFWRGYQLHQDDEEMDAVVERLKTNGDFAQRCERLERGDPSLLFVEHGCYTLRHAKLGRLRYNAWRTHFMADERFIVTHCTPTDDATSTVFGKLARKLRA